MATTRGNTFPFSAIVGQDELKAALMLIAVDPALGGLLVTGQKGTAKSTAVRALVALLPTQEVIAGCRFGCDPYAPGTWCPECADRAGDGTADVETRRPPLVELPVSATEDRLLGTLDFEHTLRTGTRRFEPGLLAEANRGLLYADEANLLDDHLVDSLLDVAASGVNTVQREGVGYAHPARFVLIGTMNPEEGEVRPQLLDRFGLSVRVAGLDDPRQRVEVVRRRVAFDEDPAALIADFAEAELELAAAITEARARLSSVDTSDEMLFLVAGICSQLGVDGHRADITIARAARAHAALGGTTSVTADDIRAVAPLALAHRVRRAPAREDDAAEALARVVAAAATAGVPAGEDTRSVRKGKGSDPGGADAIASEADGSPVAATPPREAADPEGGEAPAGHVDRTYGRRSIQVQTGRGRYTRSSPDMPLAASEVAMDASLRAAAARSAAPGGTPDGPVALTADDLRSKTRSRRVGRCVVLCVDASGSMGAGRRIEAAKSCAIELLEGAGTRRDRVAVVVFRGDHAEVVLAATTSVELARRRLEGIVTGGTTPLASGIRLGTEQLATAVRATPGVPGLLVVLTDGRANVGTGGDPAQDALEAAADLRRAGHSILVAGSGPAEEPGALARALAREGGGRYVRFADPNARGLAAAVRMSAPTGGGPVADG